MTIRSDYMTGYDNGWRDGVKDYKEKNKPSTAPTTGSAPESVIRDALIVAYAEGWAASGEGYNYEYPGRNFSIENWEAKRNLTVGHLVNRIAASMSGDKS